MKKILILFIIMSLALLAKDRAFELLWVKVNHGFLNGPPGFEHVASSYLVEPGKRKDLYSPNNVYGKDGSWCVRKNQGIGEFIYLHFMNNLGAYFELEGKPFKVNFSIQNGYEENKSLFLANNRVKRVRLDLTEVAYGGTEDTKFQIPGTDLLIKETIHNKTIEFELQDSMEWQEMEFEVTPLIKGERYASLDLLVKMTILEVYPGTKYRDTCVAEASFQTSNAIEKSK